MSEVAVEEREPVVPSADEEVTPEGELLEGELPEEADKDLPPIE